MYLRKLKWKKFWIRNGVAAEEEVWINEQMRSFRYVLKESILREPKMDLYSWEVDGFIDRQEVVFMDILEERLFRRINVLKGILYTPWREPF